MDKQQARYHFNAYFYDLKREQERDGAVVDRRAEWERFVEFHIEEGDLPDSAASWPCPRS